MACSHIAPNGQPSLLAQQLLDTYQDLALRDRVMSYIYSDNFKVQFNTTESTPRIRNLQGVENVALAEDRKEGISVLRKIGTIEHYGNPFSPLEKSSATVRVKSVEEAVQAYKDWLAGTKYQNIEPERRKWILSQIDTGKLDNTTLLYYKDVKHETHADALLKFVTERRNLISKDVNGEPTLDWVQEHLKDMLLSPLAKFINHSGGAIGADKMWDEIGKEFGMITNRHYFESTDPNYKPGYHTAISQQDYNEGRIEAARAARRNYGYEYKTMKDARLIRNWAQVKYSDAVFAISSIAEIGEGLFPNQPNDTRKATNQSVKGGTSYAVGMAILNHKPVFIFDQTRNKWYKWEHDKFVETTIPILTPNFAGIGTRHINDAGKQAIKAIYENTIKSVKHNTITITQETSTIKLVLNEGKVKQQLTLDQLKDKIRKELFEPALKEPGKLFEIDYTDFDKNYKGNLGYGPRDIAYMLDELGDEIPSNLKLSETLKGAMANSPNRIRLNLEKLIEDQGLRVPINADGKILYAQLERMSVPILDDNGNTIGLYDEVEQDTAFQTVMGLVYNYALKVDPKTPINKVLNQGLWLVQQYKMAAEKAGNTTLTTKYANIVKSFAFTDDRPSFTSMVLKNFEALGYKVDDKTKTRLLEYLTKQKSNYTAPLTDLQLNGEEITNIVNSIDATELEAQFKNDYTSSLDKDASRGRGTQDWSEVSFEIDQRDTASTRMKMFLSTIEESEFSKYEEANSSEGAIDLSHIQDITKLTLSNAIQANGKKVWHNNPELRKQLVNSLQTQFNVISYRNSLQVNQLVEFDSLFENALNTLAGQSNQTIENYVKLLRESGTPNLIALANKLDGIVPGKLNSPINEQLRNEFVKVFSKQYNPFLMVLSKLKTDTNGNEYNEIRLMDAQRGSQIQTIVKDWQESNKLSPMMTVSPTGVRILDTKRAAERHFPFIQAYNIVFNKLNTVKEGSTEYNEYITILKELLKKVGYANDAQVFIQDANGERTWMKKQFKAIFSVYGINLTDEMINGLLGKVKGKPVKNYDGSIGYTYIDAIERLTKNTKKTGNLAQQFAFTAAGQPNGLFSIFFSKAAGITSEKDIDEGNIEEGEEQATLNNPLYTESTTMKILAGIAAKYIPVIHSSTHKSIEGKKIWDYSNNTALSKRIQALKSDFNTLLEQYNDTDLISKDGSISEGSFYLRKWKEKPDYFDKFNLYYLEGLRFGGREKGTTRQRMSDREQILTSILAFQNGGRDLGHFMSLTHSDKTMTPMFNNIPKLDTGIQTINKQVLDEYKQLFFSEYRRIARQYAQKFNDVRYDEGKKYFFFLPQFNKSSLEARIGQSIGKFGIVITPQLINTLWNSNGSIVDNPTAFVKPLEALLHEHINNLTENTLNVWIENGITATYLDRNVVKKIQKSYAKPDTMTDEDYSQKVLEIAARDYAVNHFLWNTNMSMLFYGDPATTWKGSVEGTMKEYAKRLAKDIAPGQDLAFKEGATYNTITLEDVEPSEKYITELGISNKSNGTDAQELTTVQEHLDVMYAGGLINQAKYQELSKVIKDSDNGYYEFSKEQLDIIMQPMKPVYAGLRAPINGAMLYDYVKSSSYPLLPQFTKGMEIDNLRTLMENNNIQRANFISAKKIGAPVHSAELFTKDGKFKDDPSFKTSIQTLDRTGFRIQQDVPYDEEKEAIKIVSQMNKLIMEGLPDTTFTFPDGRTFNARELRKFKEQIRKDMLDMNLEDFMHKIGAKKLPDGTWSKANKQKITSLLKQEAEARGYSKNEVDVLSYLTEKGDFEVPIFLHPSVEKFESLLMSMIKKVSETKMPGKSYVQASSVGYVKQQNEADTTNVVWVGDFNPTKALRHQQLITNADGSKTVIPAQVIMPFNFFYEDGEGNSVKAKIEDFTITDENGKKTIDMERVPKELLQLIGARIPNQGHNSMVALEIVGFTPETMGDIIIVPSAITGQMGSDFDVDKLYTYKRPYQYKAGVFSNDTTGKAGLQGNYFDVHWSVLTNPEMYKKVLNPLDKPDLKDMNKRFTTKAPGFYNYFDITSQLSDFQSGKDAKALVGLTSLSVTFNSVIQDKDLKLGSYVKLPEIGGFVEDEHKLTVYYNGEKLDLTTMSGNGTNLYGDSIRTKHDNLTTIQSGAVDNAKDRTLDNLNITVSTYPAMAALHQLQTKDGKIVNIDFSTSLTTQQALWEFSREMRQGNDSLSKEYNKDLKNSVLSKLRNKYISMYYNSNGIDSTNSVTEEQASTLEKAIDELEISTKSLQKSWNKWQNGNGNTAEYAIEQLAYLKLFDKLLTYGERLGVLQKTFNQDTNGAGPSIVYAVQQQSNYENIFKKNTSKVFLNEDSIANNTEQGYLFEQLMDTAINTASEIFPIEAMYNGIEQVLAQTGKELADVPLDTQKTIIRAIRSFSLTGTDTFGINVDAERSRLLNGSKDQPSLAIRLNEWKQKLPDNYFLQRLQTNINILGKGPDTIVYENAKTVRLDDEKNVSAFMALLNSSNQDEKLLAEDLIRYTYLLNPQNGPTSFIKHIPTSYLVATKFAEDMRELMNTLPEKTKSEVFQSQLFQHNPTLTPQISSEQFGNFSVEGQDYPEWFIPENPEVLEIDSSDGKTYAKYIHYRSSKDGKVVLYRLKGEGANLIYQRIDTLGKGDKTEYNAKTTTTIRSIFSGNRALQEWTNLTSVAQALTNQVDKMIGLTEDKDNAYANWGLPTQGKMLDVNKTLDNLSEDRTIPEYYRTAARVLAQSSQTHQVHEALQALELGYQSFDIKVVPQTDNTLGEFQFSTNTLILTKTGNKVKAAETLLHEMTHQRTSALAYALGYPDSRFYEKANQQAIDDYNEMVKEFQRKNPELNKKFARLDAIRFEALTELKNRMIADGIGVEQVFVDVKAKKLRSSKHQLVYGLMNLQEFMSHIYSNKEVMQFLNTVESKESRTFVQQVWDLLSDIFVQLGEFIGTKVNDKSLLKEAYTLTMNLNNIQATEQYGIKIQDGQVVPTTLSINSQAKAEQLQDHIEHTYQQQVNHTTTLSQHLLNITDKRIDKSAEVEMSETLQKVLSKMNTQVSELNKILSTIPKTEEGKERQIIATRMKREIQADIEEMTQHKNLLELGALGAKQLEWVKNILDKSKPNVQETMLAVSLLNMWYDLDKTIYTEDLSEVNQDFFNMINDLKGQASFQRTKLLAFGNTAIRELGKQRGMELSLADLGINLKDTDPGSAYFITLSRNGNKAIQLITSIAQEAANNTDEEMVKLKNRLNKLEKLIDSIPGKKEDIWNKFIQQSEDGNAWGLVQALSADWYKFKSGNLGSLRTQLYNTNTKLKHGTGEYISAKRIAFNKFWEEVNKTAVVVDIRHLLNLDTGERVDTDKSKKEYERLLELVGSKKVVDDAIDRSIENYKEYMEHKAQYFDTTQQMQLTEEEVKAIQLTSEQLGTLTEDQQKEELQKLLNKALEDKIVGYRKSWIAHNSPATFIDTNTKNASASKLNHNMSFLPEFLPKKTSGLFDESYSDIQDDDKLKTIYSELVSMSELFRSYLPPSTQEKLHDNFLPVVTNDDVADFFGQLSKLNASKAGQHVLKQFSVTQYDKDRVHKDEIPVNFIFRNGKDVADLNKNLPKIFEMFGNMATHYKNMRPVQEVIETFEILLKDAMVNRTEGRDNGGSLNKLSEALTFYKEMLIFKKPKKLELVSDTSVYSINPVTNRKIEKRVVEIKKELDDIDEKILDNIQDDNTELKDRKEVLEKELSEYEKNARYLAGSKAADVLIGINQLKALSYNPFSAVNNMTFGVLSAFMHAYGKVDYTPKQLRWGFSQMRGSVGKYLTFGSVNSNEATKIRNIMDRIGVISEVMETMYGKSNLQSGEKAMWKKAIDPYAWQKSGDYLHKGAMVLAMMQNKKVTVTENGTEKEIPLYEALNSDGEWDVERFGQNDNWSSEDISKQVEWNKFRDKTRKVAIIVHGNQDKNAPLLAKKFMLGRLVGQFRMSWLSEGVNTRFGKGGYDAQLERDVKGRYRTYAELGVVGSLQTIFSQLSSAFVKSDPFAGKTTRKGTELTDADKENMRKNLAELVYIVGFLAALQMVKLMGPSEEEKKRRRKKGKDSINYNRLALNMLMRSYQDLTLYTSPSVFDQVTGNVVPSLTVINDARKAIGAVVELPFTDKKDTGIKATKKVFKAVPFLNLYNKIDYMMSRDISAAAR